MIFCFSLGIVCGDRQFLFCSFSFLRKFLVSVSCFCAGNKLFFIVRGSCRRRAPPFFRATERGERTRQREGWIRPPFGIPPHRPPAGVSSTRAYLRRGVRLCSTVAKQSAPAPLLLCSTRASATLPAPWGFVRHGTLALRVRFAARVNLCH